MAHGTGIASVAASKAACYVGAMPAMTPTLLATLGLGFSLGVLHALDADHLLAVSTLLGGRPSLRRSAARSASRSNVPRRRETCNRPRSDPLTRGDIVPVTVVGVGDPEHRRGIVGRDQHILGGLPSGARPEPAA